MRGIVLKHDAVIACGLRGEVPVYILGDVFERVFKEHLFWTCRFETAQIASPPATQEFAEWFGASVFSAAVLENRLQRWRNLALRKVPDLSQDGTVDRLRRHRDAELLRKGEFRQPTTEQDIQLDVAGLRACIGVCVSAMRIWALNIFFAQMSSGNGDVVELRFREDDHAKIDGFDFLSPGALLQKHGEVLDSGSPMMKAWLRDKGRRRIREIGFYPDNLRLPLGRINTFAGLPVEPRATDDAEALDRLELIHKHWLDILANGDQTSYMLQRRVVAHILFKRTKLRLMLSIYFALVLFGSLFSFAGLWFLLVWSPVIREASVRTGAVAPHGSTSHVAKESG